MGKVLVALAVVPVALVAAGDPTSSRWRSLTTGNVFEVTDYGDRLSVRFLESEVVANQITEKPDVTVSLNGPRQQVRPGRWLLQKSQVGKYTGTRHETFNCTYWRQWYQQWRTNVCEFAHPVEVSMTALEITGRSEGKPASGATFDCAKCKWTKTEKYDFQWARIDRPGSDSAATPPPSIDHAAVAMKNEDVIKLVSAGIGEEVVLAKIKAGPTAFVLDTDNILELKKAGVPDRVLAAMLSGGK